MAKLYGQLIGTPMLILQAGGPQSSVPMLCKDGADQVLWRDSLITAAGAAIGDQISLGLFKPTAHIDTNNSSLWFGALGAGCTINVGDINHPSALIAAGSVAVAGVLALAIPLPTQIIAPLWQMLGYAALPGGTIELLATFAGAAPASGQPFAWSFQGRNQ